MRLPPLPADCLDRNDETLGEILFGSWIYAQAESNSIDWQAMPEGYGENIIEQTRLIPDDYETNETLLLVLRLAANGNFKAAGQKLRKYIEAAAIQERRIEILKGRTENERRGQKVLDGAKKRQESTYGNAVEKETKRRMLLDYIDKARAKNKSLSTNQLHILASKLCFEDTGEKIGYKTFERAEKINRI
jgi:hypothetical protein